MRTTLRQFTQTSQVPASRELLARWHALPGAFERLAPPWERLEVTGRRPAPPGSPGAGTMIGDGAILRMELKKGPLRLPWVAEHFGFTPDHEFSDRALRSPFRNWRHTHRFRDAQAPGFSVLEDDIRYELPPVLGSISPAQQAAEAQLRRMFAFRHDRTAHDLARHAAHGERVRSIAITGSRGFIGTALVPFLLGGGHRVIRLERVRPGSDVGSANVRAVGDGTFALSWDAAGRPELEDRQLARRLDDAGVDAVIHLGGANLSNGRWTRARKREILESREEPTRLLARAAARMSRRPDVFIQASGISGLAPRTPTDDRDRQPLGGGLGDGFLAEVTRAWERAARPAEDASVRVVCLRMGMVLGAKGGALARLAPLYRLGLGSRLGSGDVGWPWIALDDVVGLVLFCLHRPEISGVMHAIAPEQATSGSMHEVLRHVLAPRRLTAPAAPEWALRAGVGEMADAALLRSVLATPGRLIDAGFGWITPTLEEAIRRELWIGMPQE